MDPTPPPGSLFCSEGLLNVSVISASLFPLISLSHNQTQTLSHSRYWHIKSQWNLINLPDNVRRYLVRPSILKCQRCCYQYCFSLNFSMAERYLCFLCIVLSIPFFNTCLCVTYICIFQNGETTDYQTVESERFIGSTETTVNFRSLSLSLCDNNENSVNKNTYDKRLSLSLMITDSLIHSRL